MLGVQLSDFEFMLFFLLSESRLVLFVKSARCCLGIFVDLLGIVIARLELSLELFDDLFVFFFDLVESADKRLLLLIVESLFEQLVLQADVFVVLVGELFLV